MNETIDLIALLIPHSTPLLETAGRIAYDYLKLVMP